MKEEENKSLTWVRLVIDQINNRLNHIETHIVKIYEKFDTVYEKFDAIYKKFDTIYDKFDAIYDKFDAFKKEIYDKFDAFKKEIYDKLDELRREMHTQFKWLLFIILSVLFSMWITIILAIIKFK